MSTYFTKEQLVDRYQVKLLHVNNIAAEFNCSVANVRKWVRDWKIGRGKTRQKIGLDPAWNAGKTKDSCEIMARIARDRSGAGNPMAGRPAWNRGLTQDIDPSVASVARKMTGRVVSPETREKMALAKRGLRGDQTNRWTGGLWKLNRYTEVNINGERKYLHRHIAELLLHRELQPVEEVHHIDRDHKNNHPSNLMVLLNVDHTYLHRAIERGECLTKEEQMNWLNREERLYEVLL